MPAAGAFHLRHHASARTRDKGRAASRHDGLHHFHRAALHPAGFQRGQNLQYDHPLARNHLRARREPRLLRGFAPRRNAGVTTRQARGTRIMRKISQ